jgi:hypothetical protein
VYSGSGVPKLCNICGEVIAELVALELDRMHSFTTLKADRGRHRGTTLDDIVNQHDIMSV